MGERSRSLTGGLSGQALPREQLSLLYTLHCCRKCSSQTCTNSAWFHQESPEPQEACQGGGRSRHC